MRVWHRGAGVGSRTAQADCRNGLRSWPEGQAARAARQWGVEKACGEAVPAREAEPEPARTKSRFWLADFPLPASHSRCFPSQTRICAQPIPLMPTNQSLPITITGPEQQTAGSCRTLHSSSTGPPGGCAGSRRAIAPALACKRHQRTALWMAAGSGWHRHWGTIARKPICTRRRLRAPCGHGTPLASARGPGS